MHTRLATSNVLTYLQSSCISNVLFSKWAQTVLPSTSAVLHSHHHTHSQCKDNELFRIQSVPNNIYTKFITWTCQSVSSILVMHPKQ